MKENIETTIAQDIVVEGGPTIELVTFDSDRPPRPPCIPDYTPQGPCNPDFNCAPRNVPDRCVPDYNCGPATHPRPRPPQG